MFEKYKEDISKLKKLAFCSDVDLSKANFFSDESLSTEQRNELLFSEEINYVSLLTVSNVPKHQATYLNALRAFASDTKAAQKVLDFLYDHPKFIINVLCVSNKETTSFFFDLLKALVENGCDALVVLSLLKIDVGEGKTVLNAFMQGFRNMKYFHNATLDQLFDALNFFIERDVGVDIVWFVLKEAARFAYTGIVEKAINKLEEWIDLDTIPPQKILGMFNDFTGNYSACYHPQRLIDKPTLNLIKKLYEKTKLPVYFNEGFFGVAKDTINDYLNFIIQLIQENPNLDKKIKEFYLGNFVKYIFKDEVGRFSADDLKHVPIKTLFNLVNRGIPIKSLIKNSSELRADMAKYIQTLTGDERDEAIAHLEDEDHPLHQFFDSSCCGLRNKGKALLKALNPEPSRQAFFSKQVQYTYLGSHEAEAKAKKTI